MHALTALNLYRHLLNNRASSNQGFKAVDNEILGDYAACLYAGEPLECKTRYLTEICETQGTKRDATAKIDGLEYIKLW
jgi:hypothetical protein